MQENKNASEKNITPARRVQSATKPSPVAPRAAGARVAPAPKAATAKPAAMIKIDKIIAANLTFIYTILMFFTNVR